MKTSPKSLKNSQAVPYGLSEGVRVLAQTARETVFHNEQKLRSIEFKKNNWHMTQYGSIHAIESEAGSSKWLFLHGTPAHARKWGWYLSNAPKTHHFIAPDRPGFGLNQHKKNFSSLEAQSQLMVPLFENNNDVILIGHSFGGALATQLAVDYPKKVRAIVLLASSLDPALEPLHPLQKVGAVFPFSTILPRVINNSNRELLSLHSSLPQLEKRLKTLKQPVLVIHAKDDPLCSFDTIFYYREKLINAQKIEEVFLDEGGHYLPWEKPEWILETILSFEQNIRV